MFAEPSKPKRLDLLTKLYEGETEIDGTNTRVAVDNFTLLETAGLFLLKSQVVWAIQNPTDSNSNSQRTLPYTCWVLLTDKNGKEHIIRDGMFNHEPHEHYNPIQLGETTNLEIGFTQSTGFATVKFRWAYEMYVTTNSNKKPNYLHG